MRFARYRAHVRLERTRTQAGSVRTSISFPWCSDPQCYHQLLEVRDLRLLAVVRPLIGDSMRWKFLIHQCEIYDSMQCTATHPHTSSTKIARKISLPQQTHYTFSNPSSSFKTPHQSKLHQEPENASGRFLKVSKQDNQELVKKWGCIL